MNSQSLANIMDKMILYLSWLLEYLLEKDNFFSWSAPIQVWKKKRPFCSIVSSIYSDLCQMQLSLTQFIKSATMSFTFEYLNVLPCHQKLVEKLQVFLALIDILCAHSFLWNYGSMLYWYWIMLPIDGSNSFQSTTSMLLAMLSFDDYNYCWTNLCANLLFWRNIYIMI